jgi:hypothetical protein
MHIKFLSRGKGSAKDAETYLTQEHDHKGEVRADVQVLRGNPSFVSELADSLEFDHRYTSGVIAWHVDDNPTNEQIDQVLNDFERVSFAGMDASQYAYYAVLHEEANGAKHVHVVSARVELSTGKSMNIAPPNWQKTYDVLVDKYNVKHDWASPKDLHRRQSLTLDKSMIHADLKANEAKQLITQFVNDAVSNELVTNRADVVAYLSDLGEVTREGKDYISVKPNGFKKAIKLKGAIYEREFDLDRFNAEVERQKEQRATATPSHRRGEYERVSGVLESIIADRAKFNQGKYIRSPKVREHQEQHPSQERRGERSRDNGELQPSEPRANEAQSQTVDNTDSHRSVDSDRSYYRELLTGELRGQRARHPQPNRRRNQDSQTEQAEDRRELGESLQQRNSVEEERKRRDRNDRGRTESHLLQSGGVDHDAIRKRITAELEATRGVILKRAQERIEEIREEYRGDKDSLRQADERSLASDRTAKQDVGTISEHIHELGDKHKRRTATAVADQSQQLDQATGRIGEARRGLVGAVKQCVEKAIVKVKEIAKKLSQSQSRGWSMSR